ncbi:MAG: hypothetical protein PHI23_04625 [Candidatus Peribacteraceae bacterium]|nr:hypothetical protein [Candidatus Peribacteraceae bacterium]
MQDVTLYRSISTVTGEALTTADYVTIGATARMVREGLVRIDVFAKAPITGLVLTDIAIVPQGADMDAEVQVMRGRLLETIQEAIERRGREPERR